MGKRRVYIHGFPGGSSESTQMAELSVYYGDERVAELRLPVPSPPHGFDPVRPAPDAYREYLSDLVDVLNEAIADPDGVIAGRPREQQ